MSKSVIKHSKPETNGHSDVTALPVEGETGERYRKLLEQSMGSGWVPDARRRQQQSRTQTENNYQPTEEQAQEDQQPGSVVLNKMLKEQTKLIPHICRDEPSDTYNCPGLKSVRAMLVNRARADGLLTGADDLAQQCFVSALEAKTEMRCLARWASHNRRFKWEIYDGATIRDRWRRNVQEWGEMLADENPRFGKGWVSYRHHRHPGETVGEWATEGPEVGCPDPRWDDILLVVKHSQRLATKTSCLQTVWGKHLLRQAGIEPLTDQRLADELGAIRRDYQKMLALGGVRWRAEQLFKAQG